MKKSLTIEDLKNRVGKPVFVANLIYGNKSWKVLIGTEFAGVNILAFTDSSEIPKENQDKFRFFDEEVTALELKEILDAEEKEKKKTGYERVGESEKYWSTRGGSFLDDDDFFNVLYLHGDYINNEKLAVNIARAETLKNQLRRYAALNGGIPSQKDWESNEIKKWYIDYLYHTGTIVFFDTYCYKTFGQIYFKDIKACKKAIEIFKDELIWYFTEFEEMLH